MSGILDFFSKIKKGDKGENEVLESITKLLRNSNNHNNFFLLPKVKIPDITKSIELDLLLLHPTLGIFIIEVKNWETLDYLENSNDPFTQVNNYKNILMTFIDEKLGKVPINIESRVIFPSINEVDSKCFYEEHPHYHNYKNFTFFKDDLINKDLFKTFFSSSNTVLPNKKDFMQIAALLMSKENIKQADEKIIPVITKDEVLFFDHKQLSILNGYSGDFKIIRGVAGTGKTIILTNFIQNKLEIDDNLKFLTLCFNKKLAENITSCFDTKYKKNIASYSLFQLLYRIKFDFEKVGISATTNLEKQFEILKEKKSTIEFEEKFINHLSKHPIDYFLCDETQDMPANFMRIIYEKIGDCIFFIDEAQKFYTYSMDSIADVFHHPDFEKLSMRGKVSNLKNVYRTPSNIAKCAFQILSNDTKINTYYKKSFYLKNGFNTDIKFVLEDGKINLGKWDKLEDLKKLIDTLSDDTVILTQYKKSKFDNSVSVESLEKYIKLIDKENIVRVMTFQSVKGLEAKNIVFHNFDAFLLSTSKYDEEILFRKVYVLFTRALENLYISLDNEDKLRKNEQLVKILDVIHSHEKNIMKFDNTTSLDFVENKREINLSKLKPKIESVKNTGEVVIVASELFAIVAGIFS